MSFKSERQYQVWDTTSSDDRINYYHASPLIMDEPMSPNHLSYKTCAPQRRRPKHHVQFNTDDSYEQIVEEDVAPRRTQVTKVRHEQDVNKEAENFIQYEHKKFQWTN